MKKLKADSALRICVVYVVFAGVWILCSDLILGWWVRDPRVMAWIGVAKGWLFVLVTAIILYINLRQEFRYRRKIEDNVRRLNAELEQRVRERTLQLEAANAELESFSYSVSHDLRAPLRSLDGFSQILLEEYGPSLNEEAQHYLHNIRSASQRMSRLIDALLQLSRLMRSSLSLEPLDLSQLAGEIAAELQAAHPEREAEWVIQPEMQIKGDAAQIRIALDNLLNNAWKFTARVPRARIEFSRRQVNGEMVYQIRDNGAGFDMAYSEKLFQPFQRLHHSSEFEGTGIGLTLVQRIIRRHGGRIWAEGEIGKGALISFTL